MPVVSTEPSATSPTEPIMGAASIALNESERPLSPASTVPVDDKEEEEEDDPVDDAFVDEGDVETDGGEGGGGFNDELDDKDDDIDEFDDIDEDDFDDNFDDDFEEEKEDDYEIEIEDEISAEFGLGSLEGKDDQLKDGLADFDDFENIN